MTHVVKVVMEPPDEKTTTRLVGKASPPLSTLLKSSGAMAVGAEHAGTDTLSANPQK